VSKERLGPLEDVEAALLEGLPRAFILKDEHRVLDLEPIAGVARGRIQVFGSPRTTLDEQTPMVSSSCFSQPENECAAAWNSAVTKYGAAFRAPANGPLVVASHGPALGLWDRVWGKKNVGDLLLRNFLTDVKPALHVCGHVHALQPGEVPTDTGGRGGTRVGYSDEVPGTVLANASSMQAGSKTIKLRWDRKTMGDEVSRWSLSGSRCAVVVVSLLSIGPANLLVLGAVVRPILGKTGGLSHAPGASGASGAAA